MSSFIVLFNHSEVSLVKTVKSNLYDIEINDKNGFTLIELLAVIVVLAIVMLIATNAVLPQMDEARKQAFAIEANGLVKSAQQYVVMQTLTSNLVITDTKSVCVTVEQLVKAGQSELDVTSYKGKVIVSRVPNSTVLLYKVYLNNGGFMIAGGGVNAENNANISITKEHIKAYTAADFPSSYTTCS